MKLPLFGRLALVGAASSFSCSAVLAAPVYLHFVGSVKAEGLTDPIGIVSDAGISVGSPVDIWWSVDFDATGEYTRNNGTWSSTTGFFAQIYSGDQLEQMYVNPDPLQIAEYRYGYYNPASTGWITEFIGGSGTDHVGMRADDGNPLEPNDPYVIGGIWEFYEYANTEADQTLYFADVTLIGISNSEPFAPVPIPATAWLFGSALAGLLVVERKR